MALISFAYYGGPDQIMTVTSGLASVLGVLLIFWNKVTALFFRIMKLFRPSAHPSASGKNQKSDLTETSDL